MTSDIWVLADDRPGNLNQALGVAEALGRPFRTIDIRYDGLVRLPNLLRGSRLTGIDLASSTPMTAPWPKLVISAGRRAAPVLRWIKRQSGGQTRLLQIMRPDAGGGEFDLIVVPAHDQVRHADNIFVVPAATHRVTSAKLLEEGVHWAAELAALPAPRIAVIVGGSTKKTRFTEAMATELGALVRRAVGQGSVMVTTSRRTGAEQTALLRASLSDVPGRFYDWSDKSENPYFGYLAHADALVVTGDSVSMVSEACAVPVPVHIYAPEELVPVRHRRLLETLYALGAAHPFEGNLINKTSEPLRTSEWVAAEIRRRWPGEFD